MFAYTNEVEIGFLQNQAFWKRDESQYCIKIHPATKVLIVC